MGTTIPLGMMGYQGQVIKDIRVDETAGKIHIVCNRDRQRRPVDPRSQHAGSVHRLKRRTIRDVPLAGYACEVEIEYAETYLSPSNISIEALPFVAPKARGPRTIGIFAIDGFFTGGPRRPHPSSQPQHANM